MSEMLHDRVPPQNIEAEQAVLGAIFLEPQSLTLASEILIPDSPTPPSTPPPCMPRTPSTTRRPSWPRAWRCS
ncbi:DnaB-like helicase N-terminal domain-containing protein, partial [Streptomyces vietnamensis]|uniref:DnaB-like helicase N-terminal domain-containing protein n=1 Tax=Streptomyces vietnamensis TaxID=362257 RepID=UPI00341A580C